MPPAKRAQVEDAIDNLVQFKVASTEGDLLHTLKTRHHIAFLMNSLDLAYQAPTKAELDVADQLIAEADTKLARLNAVMH